MLCSESISENLDDFQDYAQKLRCLADSLNEYRNSFSRKLEEASKGEGSRYLNKVQNILLNMEGYSKTFEIYADEIESYSLDETDFNNLPFLYHSLSTDKSDLEELWELHQEKTKGSYSTPEDLFLELEEERKDEERSKVPHHFNSVKIEVNGDKYISYFSNSISPLTKKEELKRNLDSFNCDLKFVDLEEPFPGQCYILDSFSEESDKEAESIGCLYEATFRLDRDLIEDEERARNIFSTIFRFLDN